MRQEQFLTVVDRDEAERRFLTALGPINPVAEFVNIDEAHGRVLAEDVLSPLDVPGFDRSNVDGFAVHAQNTYGANEEEPVALQLTGETIEPGQQPQWNIATRQASAIATGAVIPRGANAVVMVEHTEIESKTVQIRRPVVPGANITFAGTDIGRGETVFWAGQQLSARETGTLAALGLTEVCVWRQPRIAILSTGNEIIAPGTPMRPGLVYDSNGIILADTVKELGGHPIRLGIIPDHADQLRTALQNCLQYDMILLSGGTSKGEGDISYRVVGSLGEPGIIVHGVALKPGKPICLAVISVGERKVPVAILPGFPTSAIFTFHEFLASLIQRMAGMPARQETTLQARLPMRVNSQKGRTEYLMVGLVTSAESKELPVAFPMGKGSGSVTTFSKADGFITIPRHDEYVEENSIVSVRLIDKTLQPADFVVIGSHCIGLDWLLGQMQRKSIRCKFMAVGSSGGLDAVRRGECDLAGIHLLDPKTGVYNRPFLSDDMVLIPGYRRWQGIVYRPEDRRFVGKDAKEIFATVTHETDCILVNRNRGSGTRILLDEMLQGTQPTGYATEAKSHHAVVAAVQQKRADWGMAIENVAKLANLEFLPIKEEQYDFICPKSRIETPSLQQFREILSDIKIKNHLEGMGFILSQVKT